MLYKQPIEKELEKLHCIGICYYHPRKRYLIIRQDPRDRDKVYVMGISYKDVDQEYKLFTHELKSTFTEVIKGWPKTVVVTE